MLNNIAIITGISYKDDLVGIAYTSVCIPNQFSMDEVSTVTFKRAYFCHLIWKLVFTWGNGVTVSTEQGSFKWSISCRKQFSSNIPK